MRHYKNVTTTTARDVLEKTTCDLCGAEAVRGFWNSSNWNVNEQTVEVTIYQKEGTSYPDGGSGTEFIVDLCPKCFKETLIPFLREKGAKIEEKEWDF